MNRKTIDRVIDLSKALCPINRELRTSHVAFLIKSGKIVHCGWNKNRSHPQNLNHPYHDGRVGLHAELDVCLKSGKDYLGDYELIVIRVDKNGIVCNSRPCSGCQSVVKQFGIKEVWYSTQLGTVEKM
jgi:deoxycytidylate deaminase